MTCLSFYFKGYNTGNQTCIGIYTHNVDPGYVHYSDYYAPQFPYREDVAAKIAIPLVSSTNVVTVIFECDHFIQGRGFHLSFRAIDYDYNVYD